MAPDSIQISALLKLDGTIVESSGASYFGFDDQAIVGTNIKNFCNPQEFDHILEKVIQLGVFEHPLEQIVPRGRVIANNTWEYQGQNILHKRVSSFFYLDRSESLAYIQSGSQSTRDERLYQWINKIYSLGRMRGADGEPDSIVKIRFEQMGDREWAIVNVPNRPLVNEVWHSGKWIVRELDIGLRIDCCNKPVVRKILLSSDESYNAGYRRENPLMTTTTLHEGACFAEALRLSRSRWAKANQFQLKSWHWGGMTVTIFDLESKEILAVFPSITEKQLAFGSIKRTLQPGTTIYSAPNDAVNEAIVEPRKFYVSRIESGASDEESYSHKMIWGDKDLFIPPTEWHIENFVGRLNSKEGAIMSRYDKKEDAPYMERLWREYVKRSTAEVQR